jgi:DNA invertase Pin-like site-specific DNA recombinase
MRIGYARVSTADQSLDLQRDALLAAGCERIYAETVSGARIDRPELARALDGLRRGDALVVWKLDRLGRSLKDLVALVEAIGAKGAGLVSLSDPIDTTSAQGRLVFSIFAALAEFERSLIVERTRAGLAAARARGRMGGRPPGLSPAARTTAAAAEALYREGRLSVLEIARTLGIGKATLYRYLRHRGVAIGSRI